MKVRATTILERLEKIQKRGFTKQAVVMFELCRVIKKRKKCLNFDYLQLSIGKRDQHDNRAEADRFRKNGSKVKLFICAKVWHNYTDHKQFYSFF